MVVNCMETWKVHLPDYEFYLWNESNSPMDVTFVREAYAAKKYAFVSDYVRFWALYNEGGIYLDTDMFLLQSFDGLLNNDCFFGWETTDKIIISCGVIGCNPKQLFIAKILSEYNESELDLNNVDSVIVTRLISKSFNNYPEKETIKIYPYDYFYPFPYKEKENVSNFLKYKTDNTYAIHLWNISWGSEWAKMRDYLFYTLRKYIENNR
jgi:mannosyltransferase OCH1-like enzyme